MQHDRSLSRANEAIMRLKCKFFSRRIMAIFAGLFFSTPVFAYIGPGAGLSAIGSVIALIGALLLMILGFIWYPVKRILVRKKQDSGPSEEEIEFSEVDEPQQTSDVDINQPKQS